MGLSAPIPQPKPKHKRGKPKMTDLTQITDRVYNEIWERSEGVCEWCGLPLDGDRRNCLQAAHLKRRTQGGRGDQPWGVALLCGPSVNTGTCHNKVDYTRAGREWGYKYSETLREQYREREEDWPK